MILFKRAGCPDCVAAENLLRDAGHKVHVHDVDTVDGMMEAALQDVTVVPVLIAGDMRLDGREAITRWLKTAKSGKSTPTR